MIDLALGKKATQSSLLPHLYATLEENATNAIDPKKLDANFHTKAEWFPWWQVDLEQYCEVTEVELRNTPFHQERAKQFSILTSLDGKEWTECYSKIFHTVFGLKEDTYKAVLSTPSIGRYVRIRKDNWGEFHLRNVHIYGKPCETQNVLSSPKEPINITDNLNIVFAVNFNEEDTYLPIYIENFLNYTQENCHLVINFPVERSIPTELIPKTNRVHIFNGKIKRHKWGGTLLLGHMESYGHALTTLKKIDYFCTCATNGLFLKSFNLQKTLQQLNLNNPAPTGSERPYYANVDLDTLSGKDEKGEPHIIQEHEQNPWNIFKHSKGFLNQLKTDLNINLFSLTQIEGLFASGEEWNTLYSRMNKLIDYNNLLPEYTGTAQAHIPPLEEFIPIIFFNKYGTGKFTNICYMLWHNVRIISFHELVEFSQRLPEHMCQSKWFNRSNFFLPLQALTTKWSRQLLETISTNEVNNYYNHFLSSALATQFSKKLLWNYNFVPLTFHWHDHTNKEKKMWQLITELKKNEQQVIKPVLLNSVTENNTPIAWLETINESYFQHDMHYEALIEEDNSTLIQINSFPIKGIAGRHDHNYTRAILFLSPNMGEDMHIIRISIKKPYNFYDSILHNIRLFDGISNEAWPLMRSDEDGDICHHYFLKPSSIHGNIWIGIQSFPNTSITFEIAVGSLSYQK